MKKLLEWFDNVSLEHVPRKENRQEDSLANLASTLTSPDEGLNILLCKRWVLPPIDKDEDTEANVVSILEIDEED